MPNTRPHGRTHTHTYLLKYTPLADVHKIVYNFVWLLGTHHPAQASFIDNIFDDIDVCDNCWVQKIIKFNNSCVLLKR